MTGRYPCVTKCGNCRKDAKFFLGCINSGGGKKCPNCDVKIILKSAHTPFGSNNDEMIEEKTRIIHHYEKQYFVSDGFNIIENRSICPHGLWR